MTIGIGTVTNTVLFLPPVIDTISSDVAGIFEIIAYPAVGLIVGSVVISPIDYPCILYNININASMLTIIFSGCLSHYSSYYCR